MKPWKSCEVCSPQKYTPPCGAPSKPPKSVYCPTRQYEYDAPNSGDLCGSDSAARPFHRRSGNTGASCASPRSTSCATLASATVANGEVDFIASVTPPPEYRTTMPGVPGCAR